MADESTNKRAVLSDTELREKLTPEQYRITQEKGTEAPFSGQFCEHDELGTYRCVCCGELLFNAEGKFDSGCGWPSFHSTANTETVSEQEDASTGRVRQEIICTNCGAHLGHVFTDGPHPTGLRYCVNSAALKFDPKKE